MTSPIAPRAFDPGAAPAARGPRPAVLVVGCGNVLRGDDGAGPAVVRRLADRGVPPAVEVLDAGTAGIDVAFRMRGVPEVIVVDACLSGAPPGTLHEVPGAQLERQPSPAGLNLHALRWDQALAFGRWLLGAEYPRAVTGWLVEGAAFDAGAPLSPAVEAAVERLAGLLHARLARHARFAPPGPPAPSAAGHATALDRQRSG